MVPQPSRCLLLRPVTTLSDADHHHHQIHHVHFGSPYFVRPCSPVCTAFAVDCGRCCCYYYCCCCSGYCFARVLVELVGSWDGSCWSRDWTDHNHKARKQRTEQDRTCVAWFVLPVRTCSTEHKTLHQGTRNWSPWTWQRGNRRHGKVCKVGEDRHKIPWGCFEVAVLHRQSDQKMVHDRQDECHCSTAAPIAAVWQSIVTNRRRCSAPRRDWFDDKTCQHWQGWCEGISWRCYPECRRCGREFWPRRFGARVPIGGTTQRRETVKIWWRSTW